MPQEQGSPSTYQSARRDVPEDSRLDVDPVTTSRTVAVGLWQPYRNTRYAEEASGTRSYPSALKYCY
jgi:hypothetical protein